MTRFFTAPDGADEPTIWERTDGDPAVVVRRAELPGPHADLLWSILRGVLTGDGATVRHVELALHKANCCTATDVIPERYGDDAHVVLAALRGEQ